MHPLWIEIGPIGKNVKDCAALFEIIAGHDSKDSTSADVPVESYDSLVSGGLSGMRIGIPKEYLAEGCDEEVKKALADAVHTLSKNGAVVEFFSLGMVDYVIPAYYIIACAEASSNLERFDGVKYGYRTPGATELHEMYKKSACGRLRRGSKTKNSSGIFRTECRLLRCLLYESTACQRPDQERI